MSVSLPQEVILKNILHPALRLLSTTKFVFPSREVGRAAVAAKYVDAVYVIAQRIGQEMTKKHLAAPSLQRFFLAFDKAYERLAPEETAPICRSGEVSGSPLRVGAKVEAASVDSGEDVNNSSYR
ncbi:hypothetical protein PR048_028304 [Dryococelus australis]|uniref:Uncharacterized protein n=1 Tax=Dryococelus australis TaxID=614101 RepID=A0ABQ9GIW0_9NEOP|nr:hypothetical protein PR048_028304 [Dryococelus australis]